MGQIQECEAFPKIARLAFKNSPCKWGALNCFHMLLLLRSLREHIKVGQTFGNRRGRCLIIWNWLWKKVQNTRFYYEFYVIFSFFYKLLVGTNGTSYLITLFFPIHRYLQTFENYVCTPPTLGHFYMKRRSSVSPFVRLFWQESCGQTWWKQSAYHEVPILYQSRVECFHTYELEKT